MTTELVDGEPLRTAVLTPRKTFDVAAQIADGLAAAHAAGVVHRDLKPDNVMLTRDGRVKLLDFGIAKAIHLGNAADPTVAHTEAGLVVGTARYMSPEQVRGGTVDQRTDIFAFGALLYELVSGRPAFTGDSAAEIMTAILKHEPADMPATVPPMIRQIVRRCLEKQPDERFQSARDLAFALRQCNGRFECRHRGDCGHPAASPPLLVTRRGWRRPRRNRGSDRGRAAGPVVGEPRRSFDRADSTQAVLVGRDDGEWRCVLARWTLDRVSPDWHQRQQHPGPRARRGVAGTAREVRAGAGHAGVDR